MIDRFGRSFPYLRLSITDVCNFKCSYCLPDGYKGDADGFLGVDEIRRLIAGFAELGTRKVRLTGGEPTLRDEHQTRSDISEHAAPPYQANTQFPHLKRTRTPSHFPWSTHPLPLRLVHAPLPTASRWRRVADALARLRQAGARDRRRLSEL